MLRLYLIEILHQTTTRGRKYGFCRCCILSKFYIKPQLLRVRGAATTSCILSKFYIKPQQFSRQVVQDHGCILSKFYIKPQLIPPPGSIWICCILSKFYIKPQLFGGAPNGCCVVSYRNSTSNHNFLVAHPMAVVLYLIEILHQTTTFYFKFQPKL